MKPRPDCGRGQGLVEFALVIPLFLMLLFAMVDLGRVIWANNTLANAAREATRFAIVHGASKSTACPVGPAGQETVIPAASASCPYPSPSKQSIIHTATTYAVAAGSDVTVTVCYGEDCTGTTDTSDATTSGAVRGTPVTVMITSRVGLVTGSFLGLGNYQIIGSSTMLVNH